MRKIIHFSTLFFLLLLQSGLLQAQFVPSFVWANKISGTGYNSATAITVDNVGNVITSGIFSTTTDFDPGAGVYNLTGNLNDGFITKVGAAGNFIWAKQFTTLAPASTMNVRGMVTDATGNIYVTGGVRGIVDLDPGPAVNAYSSAGGNDLLLMKLDPNGNLLWVHCTGNSLEDLAFGISMDTNGDIVIAGVFTQTVDFDLGPALFNMASVASTEDVFVAKYDQSSNLIWAKSMGGNGFDDCLGIATDVNNNVYTTGWFNNEATADYDPGPAVFNLTVGGCFVSKLDQNGNFVYAKKIGETNAVTAANGLSIAVDQTQKVFITALVTGANDLDPGPAVNMYTGTGQDLFIICLDNLGNLAWIDQLPNMVAVPATPMVWPVSSIALDVAGNLYLTGDFYFKMDFDPGSGTTALTPRDWDSYVLKLTNAGALDWVRQLGDAGATPQPEQAYAIKVDAAANIYFCGAFWGGANTADGRVDFDPCTSVYNLTPFNSSPFTVKWNQVPVLPASVTITASATSICPGTNVTFTAQPVNGGAAPVYQWKLNNVNVGTNSPTYSNSALVNGDVVKLNMQPANNCTTLTSVFSNSITITVIGTGPATVSIATPVTTFCSGTSISFTATPGNEGTAPVYQWKVNGVNAGTNSPVFTSTSLANADVISCMLTSNSTCAVPLTAVSNNITVTVNPNTVSTLSITPSANNICTGTNVVFTAVAGNVGLAPQYQWTKNGINVGFNSTTYTDNTLLNGDIIACSLISFANCLSTLPVTSNSITMIVNAAGPPSVSIATPANNLCPGTSVTFTATPVNGGATPAYQWKVNGINVGTNSATFTSAGLASGNLVSCILTSNASCAVPATAVSNLILVVINASVVPAVSITASANNICSGTAITFTAMPVNGGTVPSYQWKVNGINAGSNNAVFTTSSLVNGAVVTCTLTSNAVCASPVTVLSNNIVMIINATAVPSVSITASANNICSGTAITFTAMPVNGGTTPVYQWKINGINAGTNSSTFTSNTLVNADIITCTLTSNANCAAPLTALSNTVVMSVNATVIPSISIIASANNICTGSSVTFTATAINGGATPAYQWKINGINAGTNSSTFTSTTLLNADIITCTLTSNSPCAAPLTALSNTVTMIVNAAVVPAVSITASANNICPGTSITFTAVAVNGGATPAYQWKINGINAGTNSSTFTSTGLLNGNIVSCVLTSNSSCASPVTASSNNIMMVVNAAVVPAVSITASSNNICPGTSITFTAIAVNGGATPAYQWKINGINTGTNSSTFTSNILVNADMITCTLTSNANCAAPLTALSNTVVMSVNATVVPSISIIASANNICTGSSVTFTATPINGGAIPAYQWKINGINAGTNSSTFTSTTLLNADIITCTITSNSPCAAPLTALSNSVTMILNAAVVPAVSIAASANNICPGTSITFTAVAVNGGATPAYQWKINGINAGTNSSTFTSTGLLNGDIVSCVLTSNSSCALPATAISNNIMMVVNAAVIPLISITASANNICTGTSVTFTAVAVNGGATPVYQWKINGINAGTNSSTFTSNILVNADMITCTLTSNANCAGPLTLVSNTVTMIVNAAVVPSISIVASANNICTGSSVTFTATSINGGATPAYQWKINGVNAGTNSSIFTSTTLLNNDIITCTLTSNAVCVSPTITVSNNIVMAVNATLVPALSITSVNNICSGTNVVFTATPVNAGSVPVYQWKVNGVNAGANSLTFASAALINGDIVTCTLTSSNACASAATVVSNTINMLVNPTVAPSVSIIASANNICAGTTVTFTANSTNAGNAAFYQWKINGVNVGSNNVAFTSAGLSNGDIITCTLTSNAICAFPSTVVSNNIFMSIQANLIPAVNISPSLNNICAGIPVTFTAVPVNGGNTPVYQWKINGINTGTNNAGYTNSGLQNNDLITCVLTSNAGCLLTATALSNTVSMIVNTSTPASIAINVFPLAVCAQGKFSFTAAVSGTGIHPQYQWQVNGLNAGENNIVYTNSNLSNGDQVTCTLTPGTSGCTTAAVLSNTITAAVYPLPLVTVSPVDTIVNAGSEIHLNANVSPDVTTYQWQPATSLVSSNSLSPTTQPLNDVAHYNFYAVTNKGCAVNKMITIRIYNKLLLPNAFTPNNDGKNDLFRIPPDVKFTLAEFSIYNRWGMKIFFTKDITKGWDGKFKGLNCDMGNYTYLIKGNDQKAAVTLKGTFILIR